MSLFIFWELLLLDRAVQLWRKRLIMAFFISPLGADALIIRSVTVAHSGLFGEKSRASTMLGGFV
jgi:hypothetical protein